MNSFILIPVIAFGSVGYLWGIREAFIRICQWDAKDMHTDSWPNTLFNLAVALVLGIGVPILFFKRMGELRNWSDSAAKFERTIGRGRVK